MSTVTEIADRKALKQLNKHRTVNDIRERAATLCKDFKVSWVSLGQALHAIEEDRLYQAWGFAKLEDYTVKELGFNLQMARKLMGSYSYLIEEEPQYLSDDFKNSRKITQIPSLDEVNFLRVAKGKKELLDEDHTFLKKQVFDKGKIGAELRRELTNLMKERKVIDPVVEQEKRKDSLINSLIRNLTEFHADMMASKLVSFELINEAEELLNKLKEEKQAKR